MKNEIKRYVIKYLLIAVGLTLLRLLLRELLPDLFLNTIVGDGFTSIFPTFFGIFQREFFNIILGVVMAFDLYKMEQNWIIIPFLTILIPELGFFFFALLVFRNLIYKHEQIQFSKDS